MYIPQDAPLVLHLPTSWQPARSWSCPHILLQRWGCQDSNSCPQNTCEPDALPTELNRDRLSRWMIVLFVDCLYLPCWPNGIKPVFYFPFDTLDSVQLMEGTVQTEFSALVEGKVRQRLYPNTFCQSEIVLVLVLRVRSRFSLGKMGNNIEMYI